MDVQPGSVILFSGTSWQSYVIKFATYSPFYRLTAETPTHVGVVCRIGPMDLEEKRDRRWRMSLDRVCSWEPGLYIVEATTLEKTPCLVQGRSVHGVQVHGIKDRVASYPGRSWVMNPTRLLSSEETYRLTQFLLDKVGFDYDKPGALAAGTQLLKHLPPLSLLVADRTQEFCVEIVGEALRKCGYLAKLDFNPGAIAPRPLVELLYNSGLYSEPKEVER